MKWENRGLVFSPAGRVEWARHSALQPTPLVLDDRIRVYAGFRDDQGIGRVGWVDLDRRDPTRILDVAARPALDIGEPGCFDDNGVVPCAVVARGSEIFLYYAGYQLGHRVRFMVFGGLAVSRDGGRSFTRHTRVPVTDRTDDALCFRVIHSILPENGGWRAWFGAGSVFRAGGGKTLPEYNVRHTVSADGIRFPDAGTVVLDTREPEYRVGRPYVVRDADGYRMYYGWSTADTPYRLGFAVSADGLSWHRRDDELGLPVADWDRGMSAYPAVVTVDGRTHMLYNGNDYGHDGFGLATLSAP